MGQSNPVQHRRWPALALLTLAGGAISFALASTAGITAATISGAIAVLVCLLVASELTRHTESVLPRNPGRRRLLAVVGGMGLALVAGGGILGRVVRSATRPDPDPIIDSMAEDLGAEVLELVRRTYYPGRSGDLQLVLTPGSTANYPPESTSLVKRDPRSSHALPWMYLERVPVVVYAPGMVDPLDDVERVTLADLAPTAARLMGFDGFEAVDGRALPGIGTPTTRPKVIVTFVIDGGGWNVLNTWDDAWPNLRRLMGAGATYRNAIMGSFPAVTACAHATIGTGAFPRTHGISGHNIRDGATVRKAYGVAGRADPSDILVPTLADRWSEETGNRAWVGEIGFQVWHLGMLGHGGLPLGDKPVGIYWNDDANKWRPHNPELYRLPKQVPPLEILGGYADSYATDPNNQIDAQFNPKGKSTECCSPPIIRYQGDLIEATMNSEAVGGHDVTDLLFINYKAPDYAGHTYNMVSRRTGEALAAVDEQLGRLASDLETRFDPGEFALIVCADHGQCPTVELTDGVRLDPIQLADDLNREFGGLFTPVTEVVPSEVYLDETAMRDAGVRRDDVAAFLRDYRYGDNIGAYVDHAVVDRDRLDRGPFAAVLSTDFIAQLASADLARYGIGRYESASDSGIPPRTW